MNGRALINLPSWDFSKGLTRRALSCDTSSYRGNARFQKGINSQTLLSAFRSIKAVFDLSLFLRRTLKINKQEEKWNPQRKEILKNVCSRIFRLHCLDA
jgi:hypothetical protein